MYKLRNEIKQTKQAIYVGSSPVGLVLHLYPSWYRTFNTSCISLVGEFRPQAQASPPLDHNYNSSH